MLAEYKRMRLIEEAMALIAPHHCLLCGSAGALLCEACRSASIPSSPSRCYRCHAASRQSAVCTTCRKSVGLSHVWVCVRYDGAAKELVHRLKFQRAKAGAKSIARVMEDLLPAMPEGIIISHIPTADSRVRLRGYDQSELIAKHLAKSRNIQYEPLLRRFGSSRQVGSSRTERFRHLEKALKARTNAAVKGRHVLLIDDITTTGATIEAAANLLKQQGAKTIDALVFAQPES